MSIAPEAPSPDGLRQLRHDLLNSINVLVGATGALQQTTLDDMQRSWVRMLATTTGRLLDIVNNIEHYRDTAGIDGEARLADLCSIAVARLAKPFDRGQLRRTIEAVAGPHPLRILLVDDAPEVAVLVKSYTRDTDWDIHVVESGERAVAQATTERYDVVLMDIDLPGLDGATAAHAIRAADLARGASPTPIIAMTAFDPAATDARPASGDDPEIAALVPGFLQTRREELLMYRDALASGDFRRIQAAAHKMKGTGRSYGFPAISRIGEALEAAAHARDAVAVSACLDELDKVLQEIPIGT